MSQEESQITIEFQFQWRDRTGRREVFKSHTPEINRAGARRAVSQLIY